jgi:Asp/Glu/hydantoin racemase
VPVIDGVVAAVKLLEAVHEYGKNISKALMFQPPRKKKIVGFEEIFQP